MHSYYHDKLPILNDVFRGQTVTLHEHELQVGDAHYPIIDDVIVLLATEYYTPFVQKKLQVAHEQRVASNERFAADIQYSFGDEWNEYSAILPEHQQQFEQYFDIFDLTTLRQKRVCDLGCGSGRWSYFLKEHCQSLLLVDFSDAIFAARNNLADANHCLFFMADLQKLPFADDFADFLICLGVLHHLPTPCLDEVRKLKRCAPQLLIFLYYALDNRPFYFRTILSCVTLLRNVLAKIRQPGLRRFITTIGTYLFYIPPIYLGHLLKPLHLSTYVPLYDFYHDKGIERIKQDVYDRFFTSIEQRVTREEISQLGDTFSHVTISENLSYWHFLCER